MMLYELPIGYALFRIGIHPDINPAASFQLFGFDSLVKLIAASSSEFMFGLRTSSSYLLSKASIALCSCQGTSIPLISINFSTINMAKYLLGSLAGG